MPNNQITSLHSPHVERVKALLGSRGKKVRQTEKEFIADGIQTVREALTTSFADAPELINLYVTEKGFAKLEEEIDSENEVYKTLFLIQILQKYFLRHFLSLYFI